MSFFKKMKERLFKSSSKLDEGLERLVEDGGTPEPAATATEPPREVPPPPAPEVPKPAETPEVPPPAPSPAEPVAPPAPEVPAPPREASPGSAPAPAARPLPNAAPEPEPVAPAPKSEAPAPAPARPMPPSPPKPRHATAEAPLYRREEPPAAAPEPAARQGILGRVFGGRPAEVKRVLDDEMLESLEEVLIQADMGVETSIKLSARLAETHFGRRVGTREIKEALAKEIAAILTPVARPLPIYAKRPQVVLVVGVNGSGKTTTIGKLASQLRSAGKTVVIAAGDTFRAAAVEQLQVWGQRAGVPVMTAPQGSDPASLAFEAMARAEAEGADMLLIDTAGRLQNRQDLMEELAKIVRVIRKRDPEAPHNTVLVLDATTGQNALSQVDIFQKIAAVSGLVMTKLDGTAKGGVLVALADRFGLPIHAIGVGEQIDDLDAFDPDEFARALTGAGDGAR